MNTLKNYGIFISVFAMIVIVSSYVSGPPAGTTSAPGETSCATSGACHIAAPNTGPGFGDITIDGGVPSNGYVPGQTYMLMPYIMNDTFTVHGFETVAILANGTGAGMAMISNALKTQMITSGNKEYVAHTTAGAQNPGMHDWMYDWTAPPKGSGTVIIYGAFVAADGDGSVAGDRVYTDSLILNEDTTAGIRENGYIFAGNIVRPAGNKRFRLDFGKLSPGEFSVKVLNNNGQFVYSNDLSGYKTDPVIDLSFLPQGIYMVTVTSDFISGKNVYKTVVF